MHDFLGVPFSFTWEIYGDMGAHFNDCFRMFNPLTKDHLEQVDPPTPTPHPIPHPPTSYVTVLKAISVQMLNMICLKPAFVGHVIIHEEIFVKLFPSRTVLQGFGR